MICHKIINVFSLLSSCSLLHSLTHAASHRLHSVCGKVTPWKQLWLRNASLKKKKEKKSSGIWVMQPHLSTKPLWMLVFIFCVRCSTLAWKHRAKPHIKPERWRPATCTSSRSSHKSLASVSTLPGNREVQGDVWTTRGRHDQYFYTPNEAQTGFNTFTITSAFFFYQIIRI